jgi:hypothetical protein
VPVQPATINHITASKHSVTVYGDQFTVKGPPSTPVERSVLRAASALNRPG